MRVYVTCFERDEQRERARVGVRQGRGQSRAVAALIVESERARAESFGQFVSDARGTQVGETHRHHGPEHVAVQTCRCVTC
jgi:hypothetical protein